MLNQHEPKEEKSISFIGFLGRCFLIIVFVGYVIIGLHKILEAAKCYQLQTTQIKK